MHAAQWRTNHNHPPPQTCQLVLGAGAMHTAGLKSISAKHLAVSCEAVHMLAVLLPTLREGLVATVPHQRRALLMPEFDHLVQVGWLTVKSAPDSLLRL